MKKSGTCVPDILMIIIIMGLIVSVVLAKLILTAWPKG